jgi:hypothetical protein
VTGWLSRYDAVSWVLCPVVSQSVLFLGWHWAGYEWGMRYVIQSKERGTYFVAIHGFTPFYGELEKARRFPDVASAKDYALRELFTTSDAFEVVAVNS